MNALKSFFLDLRNDEDGAAFLEYTVLLGIILAVSVAIIFAVGGWAGQVWGVLCDSLASTTIAGVTDPVC
jgi:pilus assembly protein Flp/PilA